MPYLSVNLNDEKDVVQGIETLQARLIELVPVTDCQSMENYLQELKDRASPSYKFLLKVFQTFGKNQWTLPEIVNLFQVTPKKAKSKLAVLGRPSKRLGLQFFCHKENAMQLTDDVVYCIQKLEAA